MRKVFEYVALLFLVLSIILAISVGYSLSQQMPGYEPKYDNPPFGRHDHNEFVYDRDCCSNKDCFPLNANEWYEDEQGYHISPKVNGNQLNMTIPHDYNNLKRSNTEVAHLCLNPFTGRLLCFYAPDKGI